MSDPIRPTPSRPLGHAARGTQPLEPRPDSPASAPQRAVSVQDARVGNASGNPLEAFVRQTDPLADLKERATLLLAQLPPHDRAIAERRFERLFSDIAPQGSLEEFRAELTERLKKFQEFVESRKAEHQYARAVLDAEWTIFLKALERYIESLKVAEKVETMIQQLRDAEQSGRADQAEQRMLASRGQGPENDFSLLSAHLSK